MSGFNFDEQTLSDKRYQFGWVPSGDIHNAKLRGWEHMIASEYPQISGDRLIGDVDDDKYDLIIKGGMVAMRRKVELKEQEERQMALQQNLNSIITQNSRNSLLSSLVFTAPLEKIVGNNVQKSPLSISNASNSNNT